MTGLESLISEMLLEMAHHPYLLYTGVILILFGSSFGLPMPEEVVLITCGMVAYVALAESAATGAPPTVSTPVLAGVCFVAVFMSDLLVFSLGRFYGMSLLTRRPFSRFITPGALAKVHSWTQSYGLWACCIFRFTPGIRFPGHFMCGAMKVRYRSFFATDGVAALLTVPTQVILLAYYGDEILATIKQFKIGLFAVLGILFVIWLARRLYRKSLSRMLKSI